MASGALFALCVLSGTPKTVHKPRRDEWQRYVPPFVACSESEYKLPITQIIMHCQAQHVDPAQTHFLPSGVSCGF